MRMRLSRILADQVEKGVSSFLLDEELEGLGMA